MPQNLNRIHKATVKLLRWHRRLGLLLALLLVLLAVTGILINHTSDLKLADIQLKNRGLLAWYGLEESTSDHGFKVTEQTWISEANNQLFFNQAPVTACPAPLLSAAKHPKYLLALCQGTLILLTAEGKLLEKLTFGLPEGANALTITNAGDIQLRVDNQTLVLDLDTLTTSKSDSQPTWPVRQPLPDALKQSSQTAISLETLLLDIHSGRILGRFGVFLMDITALLICLLALSGFWAWGNHRRLLRRRRR